MSSPLFPAPPFSGDPMSWAGLGLSTQASSCLGSDCCCSQTTSTYWRCKELDLGFF